ncbi:MAG: hypothetical protein ACK5Y2_09380 [Bdellovibrionales bacterium]
MKKIISPLVLAALLIWTWHTVHSPSAIGFETHSGVQLKLAELIGNTLQAKKPDAENLKIVKIWTSPLSENKIQALFTYQFTEKAAEGGTADKVIQGEAVLYREPSEDPTLDKWVLQSVKTELEALNFTEGSEVLPLPEEGAPAETAKGTPAPETKSAPTEKK